ncbi:MAG TPA: choice-of-anchor Q domain-containing protein [Pseudomonadota bacterium]|jgi:predicted outer membrane repeat protein|nr:choice-of-anchor Q domain-containing protein [Pseudomonadota bacterium]
MPFALIRDVLQYGLAVVLLFMAAIVPSHAQVPNRVRILITTPGDPDPAGTTTCSLRQALSTASPSGAVFGNCVREPSSNPYSFLVEMATGLENPQITLQYGQLEAMFPFNQPYHVTVRGRGLVVDASGASRVLRVYDTSVSTVGAGLLTLEDMTLKGGVASGNEHEAEAQGGGILMVGGTWLTLRRVTITDNQAVHGGGVSLVGGFDGTALGSPVLRVYDSTFSDNEAIGNAAALQAGRGGGLAVFDLCAAVVRTTFHGNRAGYGGAILATNAYPAHYCAPSANLIPNGFGLYQSTLSGNVTPSFDGTFDYGVAAIEAEGPLRLEGTTVTANHGAKFPAIRFSGPGDMEIVNSIVSGNLMDDLAYEFSSPDVGAVDGTTRSAANSVLGTATQGQIGGAGNVWSDTPGLGALFDNGGFTLTHFPSATSPAIALGREPECSTLAQNDGWIVGDQVVDQRHVTRPQGAACEAGAVERRQGSFVISANVVGSGRVDATLVPTGAGSSGGISNCSAAGGTGCTATFIDENNASTLKFIATPSPGWWLEGWSGDCVASTVDASAWLSVDGARNCTATFSSNQLFVDGFETAN